MEYIDPNKAKPYHLCWWRYQYWFIEGVMRYWFNRMDHLDPIVHWVKGDIDIYQK